MKSCAWLARTGKWGERDNGLNSTQFTCPGDKPVLVNATALPEFVDQTQTWHEGDGEDQTCNPIVVIGTKEDPNANVATFYCDRYKYVNGKNKPYQNPPENANILCCQACDE